ncbi:MAG: hypothetical protein Q9177_000970 [Variospora cf. flavescens]
MDRWGDVYGEPEHPSSFSYPPVLQAEEGLPGVSPNPPWMYIRYYPDGSKVTYRLRPNPYGTVGIFQHYPPMMGAILCRGNCLADSACERRLEEFFLNAAARVGWRGNDEQDLIYTVMEAIEGGVLDRYGMPTESSPGREVGYSERYRH